MARTPLVSHELNCRRAMVANANGQKCFGSISAVSFNYLIWIDKRSIKSQRFSLSFYLPASGSRHICGSKNVLHLFMAAISIRICRCKGERRGKHYSASSDEKLSLHEVNFHSTRPMIYSFFLHTARCPITLRPRNVYNLSVYLFKMLNLINVHKFHDQKRPVIVETKTIS
jgi:hypothetical protein